MDSVEALTHLGGIASTRELLALTTRKRLRRAVACRRVLHVSRARYALPAADHARALALEVGGHLRLLSAAAHWGWKVKWSASWPQLLVAEKPSDPVEAELSYGTAECDGWATSRLQTVLDCAADLPFDEALAVADSALRSGDVTREELDGTLGADTAPLVRRVLEHATPLAANPFESVLRGILIEAGIDVVPQWAITSALSPSTPTSPTRSLASRSRPTLGPTTRARRTTTRTAFATTRWSSRAGPCCGSRGSR
nr:hypothetical protein [Nocardioides seonyuensis]